NAVGQRKVQSTYASVFLFFIADEWSRLLIVLRICCDDCFIIDQGSGEDQTCRNSQPGLQQHIILSDHELPPANKFDHTSMDAETANLTRRANYSNCKAKS
ncbi:hypothetical protein KIN20_012718, partial [Parelaphostrongylus tenuis]